MSALAFVQFFVLDKMFAFIQNFTPASVNATPDIASLRRVHPRFYLAFGLAFQVPIVVMLLVRFEIVTVEKLKAFRGCFIVAAFVIAAFVTPPDVISQLALAVPMCLLYEIGIWGSRWFARVSRAPEEGRSGLTGPSAGRPVSSLRARLHLCVSADGSSCAAPGSPAAAGAPPRRTPSSLAGWLEAASPLPPAVRRCTGWPATPVITSPGRRPAARGRAVLQHPVIITPSRSSVSKGPPARA